MKRNHLTAPIGRPIAQGPATSTGTAAREQYIAEARTSMLRWHPGCDLAAAHSECVQRAALRQVLDTFGIDAYDREALERLCRAAALLIQLGKHSDELADLTITTEERKAQEEELEAALEWEKKYDALKDAAKNFLREAPDDGDTHYMNAREALEALL